MKRQVALPILAVLWAFRPPVSPAAQREVVVGIAPFPPHVMESREHPGQYTGFDIEFWDQIADNLDLDYTYRMMPFQKLLKQVAAGEVDIALAGITITMNRERVMDFSYPYKYTGPRILTRVEERPALLRLLSSVSRTEVLAPLLYLVGFIVLCAHVFYFAERHEESISRNYFPGIFDAAWCMLATMTTVGYGDVAPRSPWGRLVAFLVMVTGIATFSILVAQLTAGLTLEQFTSEIDGPQDLRGRVVATVAGSTSVRLARQQGAEVREVEVVGDAYSLLENREVDAVVFDEVPLLEYVKQSEGTVAVVGPFLRLEPYGIAFASGSEHRERVNQAMLETLESGFYGELRQKWFGGFGGAMQP